MFFSIHQKTNFIKAIDRWFGSLMIFLVSSIGRALQVTPEIRRVLFIRPGGLGDALLLLPAIEAFAKTYPDTEIDVLAEPRNQGAFAFLEAPHHVQVYTKLKTFFSLRHKRYDLIIDTEQWYRLSVVYARLLTPKRLIGFASNERNRLLSDSVDYHQDDYEVKSFFRLLEPLGVHVDDVEKYPNLFLDENFVAKVCRDFDVYRGQKKQVAVFPGASVPEKRWPTEYYGELIAALLRDDIDVVLVGGKSEGQVASVISSETGCYNLVGKTTLTETAAVLSNMNLLITGDSALLHLAAGLGVPTVSLFGPSSAVKWAPPRKEKHVCLQKEFDCIPCSRYGQIPPCPYDVKCLVTLLPDQVLEAVLCLLENEEDEAE